MKEAVEKIQKISQDLEKALSETIPLYGNHKDIRKLLLKEFSKHNMHLNIYACTSPSIVAYTAQLMHMVSFNKDWESITHTEYKKLVEEF